ncbi:unnamed protein product [Rotaria sp. Silwood1]|nr:unnamed protein product [Rotaria sp. Silwood1]
MNFYTWKIDRQINASDMSVSVGYGVEDTTSSSCGCCPAPWCPTRAESCSSNVDCECLWMTVTGDGMCADTVISCSNLAPCQSDNLTCSEINTVCVNNTRCNRPVCFPLARAQTQRCPPKGTSTTTSRTTTTTTTTIPRITTTVSAQRINTITYSQNFTVSGTPSDQCTAWEVFRAQLIAQPYTLMTMKGTNNAVGITLTNATVVAAIAQALRTNTTYGPVSLDLYSWAVGVCGSGYEVTSTGSICACNTGYTIRPCIGNWNWGAIDGYTCSASSQTMTLIFQY